MNRLLTIALTVLLLSIASVPAFAQTAPHLYLVPAVDLGPQLGRSPKYLSTYACMDYGFQPVYLCATTVDSATDAALVAAADVQKIPDNLDSTITAGALATVQNALENRNLPAGWVTTGMTYRELIRTLGGFFVFLQRYAVVASTTELVIGGSVDLDTAFNQLPQAVRTNLQNTALSLGLSTAGLSGSATIRQILKNIADQWGQRVIVLGPITI